MLSRLLSARNSAVGLVSSLALAACTLGLSGCDGQPVYQGPELSAFERHQHERCVALLQSAWQGAPVRSTAAERGSSGLDYVWVNADVHDDQDDLDRRAATGTTHAGHCQFEHGGGVVHVHSYALTGGTEGASAKADAGMQGSADGSVTGTLKAQDSAAGRVPNRYFTASMQDPASPTLASADDVL